MGWGRCHNVPCACKHATALFGLPVPPLASRFVLARPEQGKMSKHSGGSQGYGLASMQAREIFPVKKSKVMNLKRQYGITEKDAPLKLLATKPCLSTKQIYTRRMHARTFFIIFPMVLVCCLLCLLTCSCPNRFSTNHLPNPPTHLPFQFYLYFYIFLLSHV